MRTWYSIQAKNDSAGEAYADLSIFDYIGYYGVTGKDFASALAAIDAPTIKLSINSPGGDVFEAIHIFNTLRMSGKTIDVTVMGIAASAASYIMLAGDTIKIPENAMVMVHNPLMGGYGNADEHREMADILDKVGANLRATYASRTGMEASKVDELLSKDTFLTAAECLELGLCDEVLPAVKMTAAYNVDRLPENVRALFEAAKHVAAEPTPVAVVEAPFADQVVALATAAGMSEFASTWALQAGMDTAEAVTAAIKQAREVRSLCAVAQAPDEAAKFITTGTPLAEVRAALLTMRATVDEDTHVDTSPKLPVAHAARAAANPDRVTGAGIWNAFTNPKKASK